MSTATLSLTSREETIGHSLFLRYPALLIVLVYSLCFLVLAGVLRSQYGFPLDDSYIHQTVARNLVEYGKLGFIPGRTSSGATSVLWTILQAANYKLIGAGPVLFNLAFSWLMLAAIGILLFMLARRDGLPLPAGFAFSVAPALCGNFVWLGLIGMEHLLFVALVLASIHWWFDQGQHRRRSAFLAGLGGGLVVLARPEALLFGPLLAVAARKAGRSRSETLTVLALWSLCFAMLFAVNFHTSHSFMPATMKGRTWLFFWETGGPHSMRTVTAFLTSWSIRPFMQFSLWFARPTPNALVLIPAILLPLIVATVGAFSILKQASVRMGFLFLWALIHFCTYLLQFPAQGHGGRYQPFNLLLLFPCLYFGLLWLFRRLRLPAAATLATGLLLAGGALSLRTWRTVTLDGITHINATHGATALWLNQNVPDTASVASFDIGRISYDLRQPLIDLGGLVDPAYLPYLVNRRVPAYIQQNGINYVVLPSTPQFTVGLGFSPEMKEMNRLAEFCAPRDTFMVAMQYTLDAEQCQLIYRAK